MTLPFHKYRPYPRVELPDRTTWWVLEYASQLAHFNLKLHRFDKFVALPKGSGPHWLAYVSCADFSWKSWVVPVCALCTNPQVCNRMHQTLAKNIAARKKTVVDEENFPIVPCLSLRLGLNLRLSG